MKRYSNIKEEDQSPRSCLTTEKTEGEKKDSVADNLQ